MRERKKEGERANTNREGTRFSPPCTWSLHFCRVAIKMPLSFSRSLSGWNGSLCLICLRRLPNLFSLQRGGGGRCVCVWRIGDFLRFARRLWPRNKLQAARGEVTQRSGVMLERLRRSPPGSFAIQLFANPQHVERQARVNLESLQCQLK